MFFFSFFSVNLQEIDLKKPLKIKYVGGGEQGLDMGGLQKEFFHMIVEAVFDPGTCRSDTLLFLFFVWAKNLTLENCVEMCSDPLPLID